MVPRLFAPILGLFLWEMIKMNIIIKKVDVSNDYVLDFIALEYLKMLLDINQNMRNLYDVKLTALFVEKYKEFHINDDTIIYAAFDGDDIIGALQFDNNILSCFFVKEEYRNNMVGSKLLEKLISECNNIGVIRVDARIDYISLFEKFSFKKIDSTRNKVFIPMELEMKNHGK